MKQRPGFWPSLVIGIGAGFIGQAVLPDTFLSGVITSCATMVLVMGISVRGTFDLRHDQIVPDDDRTA